MGNTFSIKKVAFVLSGFLIFITGCEKYQVNSDYNEYGRDNVGPDVIFKIGRQGDEFRFDDIELYDSSTHILYFKREHKEFTQLSEALQSPFYFLDNGYTIYSGSFVPAYSSSVPPGPMIQSPSMYGGYALRIDIWWNNKPDIRNSPRLMEILKDHNLLHSGLSGSVDFVEISGNLVSFGFTVTNHDITDLLIIDINKTGPGLFHYFTNGLYLRDQDHNEVFTATIPHEKPEPWNSWKPEWLTDLKSGESISFTIDYPIETPINPGQYDLLFEFPGLAYQILKDQLFQGSSRIWLGDITMRGKITVP